MKENEESMKSELSALAFIPFIKEFVSEKLQQAGAKAVFTERTAKNTNKEKMTDLKVKAEIKAPHGLIYSSVLSSHTAGHEACFCSETRNLKSFREQQLMSSILDPKTSVLR